MNDMIRPKYDLLHSGGVLGFVYVFECVGRDGKQKWHERVENVIPDVGRDYLLSAGLLGGSQLSSWFIGLYSNARSNVVGDTMTTLMADAGEITDYVTTGSNRLAMVPDALSNGVFSNLGNRAEFEATAQFTVRGGFICSNATQGSTAGTLLSLVANSSPKPVDIGEILRVTAGLSLITA